MEIGSRVAAVEEFVVKIEFHPLYLGKLGVLIVEDDIDVLPIPLMVVDPVVEGVEVPVG